MGPLKLGLTDLVSRAELRLSRRIERLLEPSSLTLEQWRVLTLLADGAGHPMSEIAAHAMVPPPTLTKLVDKLVDRALVYRRVDDADRRRILVFLSARGRKLHHRVDDLVRGEESEIVATLGVDDTAEFRELLHRVVSQLD
ncbi:MAG: MarR family winged helix-turn-helix transcriptional regulator [Pseudonocardia sp.]|jgi:MarR family transcriptional regulator, organic hydroperoxide resistance regulator